MCLEFFQENAAGMFYCATGDLALVFAGVIVAASAAEAVVFAATGSIVAAAKANLISAAVANIVAGAAGAGAVAFATTNRFISFSPCRIACPPWWRISW